LESKVGGYLLSQIPFVLVFSKTKDVIFLIAISGMHPSLDPHPILGEVFSLIGSLLRLGFGGELQMAKKLIS
jgi:hypothetical protein